ncbi:MAG: hypothetical protein WA821_22400 [Anaerolineales bacterium]
MDATPDTLNYMIAGYVVFTVIMTTYLASLYLRWRYLERELHALDESVKK